MVYNYPIIANLIIDDTIFEETLMPDLSVLGLFAHPDDEQMMSGLFAQCDSEGMRTGLVCATRGEAGQIHSSVNATRETVGEVREAELRAAANECGVKDLWFLDYRDSGWFDTPDNDYPTSFHRCDQQQALGKIVAIIRDFKPTILVTFDSKGGYGHLDHLMIHKLTTQAFSAAADPAMFPDMGKPWQAERLYYGTFSRSAMTSFRELMMQADPDSDFGKLDFSNMGSEDSEITNEINVLKWVETKQRSLSQHRTQTSDFERWSLLTPDLVAKMRGIERYILAAGTPLPPGPGGRADLFAGLWS